MLIKEIKDDILKIAKEILEHIDTAYYEKRIDDSLYEEFWSVIQRYPLREFNLNMLQIPILKEFAACFKLFV